MSTALLSLVNVTAGYGRLTALHRIDLEVHAGEIVALLGANGAGKSTTLRAVSGMIPFKGEVTLDGTSLASKSPERIVRLGMAHAPEGRGTFNGLTVKENLRVGATTLRQKDVEAAMEEWFEVFPRLRDRREQKAGSLSGGEQQMLAISRAMMSRPKILLLDEPSLGLAPLLTEQVFDKLGEINRAHGTAMLIVEQNANLALETAHRAYVLETGTVAASGNADELAEVESVRRAYLQV